MIHACEDANQHDCNESFGQVFFRDREGYGHWLCPRHRDLRAARERMEAREGLEFERRIES